MTPQSVVVFQVADQHAKWRQGPVRKFGSNFSQGLSVLGARVWFGHPSHTCPLLLWSLHTVLQGDLPSVLLVECLKLAQPAVTFPQPLQSSAPYHCETTTGFMQLKPVCAGQSSSLYFPPATESMPHQSPSPTPFLCSPSPAQPTRW